MSYWSMPVVRLWMPFFSPPQLHKSTLDFDHKKQCNIIFIHFLGCLISIPLNYNLFKVMQQKYIFRIRCDFFTSPFQKHIFLCFCTSYQPVTSLGVIMDTWLISSRKCIWNKYVLPLQTCSWIYSRYSQWLVKIRESLGISYIVFHRQFCLYWNDESLWKPNFLNHFVQNVGSPNSYLFHIFFFFFFPDWHESRLLK